MGFLIVYLLRQTLKFIFMFVLYTLVWGCLAFAVLAIVAAVYVDARPWIASPTNGWTFLFVVVALGVLSAIGFYLPRAPRTEEDHSCRRRSILGCDDDPYANYHE